MAETDDENSEADAGVEGEEPKKKSKLLFIIAPVALLLLGGGGYFGASMMGLLGGSEEEAEMAENTPPPAKPAYYHELPEMVVNLSSKEQRAHYLKMKIALEVADVSVAEAMQPNLPRVLDLFQVYLRELRAQDLEGSQGIYRLKEELLKRINLAVHPSRVNRILFKEIIVQ
ncbi:flagellar basal body-associated protein FliL [Hyphomicrobiales bacterium 4NK60-0047b]|jgi:flagellar FliL protein